MIPETLHTVGAERSTRPATLKLALAAAALVVLVAPRAEAQFDKGGYTSADTPEARAHQTKLQKERAVKQGTLDKDALTASIPELQVFAAVSLAETYTSNAAGSTGSNSGYDFYTQPSIHLGGLEQSEHLTASLNYTLTGQYHARDHDLDQFTHRLNAMANAELINQLLFIDAQAYAAPQALSRAGTLTAADGTPTNNNYRNTYSYSARPTLMHQFGSAVETDLWFSQSGVYFVTPSSANTTQLPGFFQPPRNSNTSAVGARIASLDDFVRLQWSLNATASDTYQSSHNSQKVRSAIANASYAITNSIAVIGTGGYQTYHSSFLLTKDLDGPTLLGGLKFTPNPNFYLFAQAGTQNNFPTYIGQLSWAITSLTSVSAKATDQVQTPQQNLTSGVQGLGGLLGSIGAPSSGDTSQPPPGTVPSPGSALGGDLLTDGLSLDNSVYRYRQFDASITRTGIRTRYDLSFFATLRDRLNNPTGFLLNSHEKNYGIRASVSHHLQRDLTGRLAFTASKANEFNGNDTILEGDADLYYTASETLTFYLNNSVLHRDSNRLVGFSNGKLTDVRITVGVSKSF